MADWDAVDPLDWVATSVVFLTAREALMEVVAVDPLPLSAPLRMGAARDRPMQMAMNAVMMVFQTLCVRDNFISSFLEDVPNLPFGRFGNPRVAFKLRTVHILVTIRI